MPIDTSIPLQAQVGNPLNALASGYQLGNTIRQQPMVDQMNQQKLQAGEIELKDAKLKQFEAASGMDKTMFKSAYYGAAQIAPYLASGDMASVERTINQRKQAKQLIGMPTDTEDNFLKELQSNPEQAKKSVANMMAIGQQLFGKSQASRSVALNPGGQLYSQDGTLLAQNNNAKPGAAPQAAGTGPQGKSVDAWAYNVLLNGDPSSKEFAAAKAHLSRSRTQLVQTESGLMPVSQPPVGLGWAVDGSNGQGAIPPPNPVGAPAPYQPPVQTSAGVIPGTGKAPTAEQGNAGGFYDRMTNANLIIDDLEKGGYRPGVLDFETADGNYLNAITSEKGQLYRQAQENWVRANLRKESGAVIGADEMDAEIRNYFPVPGDKPETVAQKAANRKVVTEAMRKAAGPAAKPSGQTNTGAIPAKNARGWTLHQDANGNKAYVGPSGEIEEVQ